MGGSALWETLESKAKDAGALGFGEGDAEQHDVGSGDGVGGEADPGGGFV